MTKEELLVLKKLILGALFCLILLVVFSCSYGNENKQSPPKPIAYWAFDEGSGTIAKDSINSHTGTIKGAIWSKDCINGKCLVFDGEDDVVEIPHHPRFNFWDQKGDSFTVVVLPDTQNYPHKVPHIYEKQTQWIVDNIKKLNIKFVLHVGDIVNNWDPIPQWKAAKKAMKTLDGEIPYLVIPGNHDFQRKKNSQNYDNYNTFFPFTPFEKYPWYGEGHYPPNGNQNNYGFFSNGEQRFIALGLNWQVDKKELKWAHEVLTKYQDRYVLIVLHQYMNFRYKQRVGNGELIFNNLISKYPNIGMVVSGHILGSGAVRRADYIDGQPVNQILQNYQHYLNGGQGYLRYYTFNINENKIDCKTYSPYLDKFLTTPKHQFSMDFRKTEMTITAWIKTDALKDQMIVAKTGRADQSFYLSTTYRSANNGGIQFYFKNTESKIAGISPKINYFDNQWHHVASVYDGVRIRLYIDGAFHSAMPPEKTPVAPMLMPEGLINSTSIPIMIGGYDGPGWRFKGKIDEVKIFNKALSPEQVNKEYARFYKKSKKNPAK